MENYKKAIIGVILTFALMWISIIQVDASDNRRTLNAIVGNVKVFFQGSEISKNLDPFIVDGTTYVPLRQIAEAMGNSVFWDETNNQVVISPSLGSGSLNTWQKDMRIQELERQVRLLEEELYMRTGTPFTEDWYNRGWYYDDWNYYDNYRWYDSIARLEDDLKRRYGEYRDVELDIYLYGDSRDIEVIVEVDFRYFRNEWNSLTTRQRDRLLQDICDEIRDEYPSARIKGKVEEIERDRELLSFDTTSRGTVRVNTVSSIDLRDLERELDDNYYDYFSNMDLYIYLKGDRDEVEFYVELDYDEYRRDWDRLTDSRIRTFMANIYDDIEAEFRRAEISGYVIDMYDGEDLARYSRNSRGNTVFRRY
ncbi:hypothetical protein GGQ84_000763 [Desulfitispora alkaliphila]|uniref:copper amine oxidase N-terminal domain-containing protein n=1 Tax=Desulfitispora alkaliphila TaxID=622674 RepID=UPI003D1B2742